MIDRGTTLHDWQTVLQSHPVPPHLHDHQIDAMALLKQGKHVFMGNLDISYFITLNPKLSAVPTGAGKTLPQLATILSMEGLFV